LNELAARHDSITAMPLDLSQVSELEPFAARAWDALEWIDVLINNAGVSQRAPFLDTDPQVIERLLSVNLRGPALLTHALGRRMRAQGFGHLVHISSVSAELPTPMRTAYSASKAGMNNLWECLRPEIADENMYATVVSVGAVRTSISKNAVTSNGAGQGVQDPMFKDAMSADECATSILLALSRKKSHVYVALSARMKVGMWFRRWFPNRYRKIIKRATVV
jgi:short-subunit dehydrogenase